jgi:8-oxo-dGTP diphosphatase
MEFIRVAAAIVHRDGRYLICRRPAGKRHAGLWEFPGGKLHDGESLEQAINRELAEELHVSATRVGPVHAEIADPGSSFVVVFVEVDVLGEPRSTEHDAVAWVSTSELPNYPLAPSDRVFAEQLIRS